MVLSMLLEQVNDVGVLLRCPAAGARVKDLIEQFFVLGHALFHLAFTSLPLQFDLQVALQALLLILGLDSIGDSLPVFAVLLDQVRPLLALVRRPDSLGLPLTDSLLEKNLLKLLFLFSVVAAALPELPHEVCDLIAHDTFRLSYHLI